jgi:Mg2+ and Co2+ transporter CorA
MNFKVGFFATASLFWVVIAVIVAMGVATVAIAKRRGWI